MQISQRYTLEFNDSIRKTPIELILGFVTLLNISRSTHLEFALTPRSLETQVKSHTTFSHKQPYEEIKPDTCWGAPPRGEPVEPRSLDLRTQSPQRQEWQNIKTRNTKRCLRNTQTIITRQEARRQNTRNRRRDRRNIRSATNKQEWRGMARHAAAQLNRPRRQRGFSKQGEVQQTPEQQQQKQNDILENPQKMLIPRTNQKKEAYR